LRGVAREVAGETLCAGGFLNPERTGREIEHRETEMVTVANQPGQIVVAASVERGFVENHAGGDDSRHLALHNAFGGGGVFHLLADRDFFAGFNQLSQITLRCVEGDAAHRNVVTFGEGDVENACSFFGILHKHFVEIAEAEKENRVFREFAPDPPVLLHHRCFFRFIAHVNTFMVNILCL